MSKTKKTHGGCLKIGRLPPDDPIYSSGYIFLRPIPRRKKEEAEADPPTPSESDNQQTTDEQEGGLS